MTGTEQQVVSCILDNPSQVLNEPISELAQRCGVSDSTVVRTCKRLGFDGYPQLKIAIAVDLAQTEPRDERFQLVGRVELTDPLDVVVKKVMQTNIRILEQALGAFDYAAFGKAVDLVAKARRVGVFATGTHAYMVDHCCSQLMLTGIHCFGKTDHIMQAMLVAVMDPSDVLLIFNHSGRIETLIQMAQNARDRGVPTIGFTSFAQSPLARSVDVCVTTFSDDDGIYLQAMGSQVARTAVIDCLLAGVACRRESVAGNFQAIRKAIQPHRT